MGIKKQEPDEKHVFLPLYLTFWENQRTLYTFLLSEIILFLCILDLFPLLKRREEKGPGKYGGAQMASHSYSRNKHNTHNTNCPSFHHNVRYYVIKNINKIIAGKKLCGAKIKIRYR
jgi:hypothetical protein